MQSFQSASPHQVGVALAERERGGGGDIFTETVAAVKLKAINVPHRQSDRRTAEATALCCLIQIERKWIESSRGARYRGIGVCAGGDTLITAQTAAGCSCLSFIFCLAAACTSISKSLSLNTRKCSAIWVPSHSHSLYRSLTMLLPTACHSHASHN